MLKIFIPMEDIDSNSGPLEIINKINTVEILKGKIALSSSPKNFLQQKKMRDSINETKYLFS